MAAFRGFPNHVQIGINDTPLSLAIEKGDFKTAEKLIEENMESSYLDEGPFEKIPLALVLTSDYESREHPRHLRLAKLLVEGGANPNLRIPQAEWQGASPSPMEHLLDLYDSTNNLCKGRNYDDTTDDDDDDNDNDNDDDERDDTHPLRTIGLRDETHMTAAKLKEQILELIDIFLACGANPNVTTTTSNSTLYHVVVAQPEPNIDLVMKLCEAGGDLNQTNIHGTTPLMDLITYADGDMAMDILHSIWQKKPDISSLQSQNCSNETALWRSMLAGSPRVAITLLNQGASPVPRAMVTVGRWHHVSKSWASSSSREIVTNGVSAILAPLLQDSSPYVRHTTVYTKTKFDEEKSPHSFHVNLLDKVFASVIAPVVDNMNVFECFPEAVLDEIKAIASSETRFGFDQLLSSAMKPQDVVTLMFGKLNAGLQQLCVREIMNRVFFTQNSSRALNLIAELKGKMLVSQKEKKSENWDENEDKKETETKEAEKIVVDDTDNISHRDIVMALDSTVIQKFVTQLLNLPPSLITRFEIEATRLQLGASLYTFESTDCMRGCDGESDEGSTEPFGEDDDDDDDDDESDWFGGFLSSDEYGEDYLNSDVEWETDENEDNSSGDDDNNDDDNDDDNNVEHISVDEDFDSASAIEMDIDSGDDCGGNSSSHSSVVHDNTVGKDCTDNPESSSGSGECVPQNICRDEYEAFGNDVEFEGDTISLESTSHSSN